MDSEKLLKHAARSATASRIEAMIELAKPDLVITADMLDADQYLLNCKNGTIDLRTGTIRPHRQEDFITKLAPVDFNPQARAPRFEQFLSEIFAGSVPLISFVQAALGYSLTGSTKEQKIFIAYGEGANGKSTLFNAVREVLGDYAQETDPTLLVAKQQGGATEDVYRLRGARFATTIESDEDVKLNEARLKQLTGGDRVVARPLYGRLAEFEPTHKLWMATNHLPRVKSQGHAIWRRICLIPFNVKMPEHLKDRDLPDKLRAEYQGVLAWLVRGALIWQQSGLPEPPEVMHATQGYKNEEDSLAAFIAACCHVDPQVRVQAQALYEVYKGWCRRSGEIELSRHAFAARLRERGFGEKQTNQYKLWCGLTFRTEIEGGLHPSQLLPSVNFSTHS